MTTTRQMAKRLQPLLLRGKIQNIPKGEIIHSTDHRPSHIHLVKSGFIKRYMISSDGRLGVQSIYGKGDILPLTTMYKILLNQEIYQGPEVFHYEAMCRSEIYTIESKKLLEAVKNDPMLYRNLLSIAGRRLQSFIARVENLELRSSYKRVAHQLVYFAKDFGEKKGPATTILVPLTHQDMADILSITRETVSLSMEKLQKEGLIRNNKKIIVPNISELEKEAYK